MEPLQGQTCFSSTTHGSYQTFPTILGMKRPMVAVESWIAETLRSDLRQ